MITDNNVLLSTSKTKELTVGFSTKQEKIYQTLIINKNPVERVDSFRYLCTYTMQDLSWSCHINTIVKTTSDAWESASAHWRPRPRNWGEASFHRQFRPSTRTPQQTKLNNLSCLLCFPTLPTFLTHQSGWSCHEVAHATCCTLPGTLHIFLFAHCSFSTNFTQL